MGLMMGPHAHTTRARETRATGPGCPPQGRAAGRGRAPDTRRPSQQRDVPLPRRHPPASPEAHNTLRDTPAKGTVPDPHTRTPAPTIGQRTPAARPEDRQPGEDEPRTPDAPQNVARHPPQGDALPPLRQRKMPASKSARCGASAGSSYSHNPRPASMGNRARPPAPRTGNPERERA